ncbi:MAG: hypothetical protein KBD01_00030 [Acidobacteria bacterium]|nr:hypothetical protein [Acidobacteriota bacterium]
MQLPRLALVCLLAASLPAFAEPVELPVDMEVEAQRISMSLRGGRVDVLVDPDAEPGLTVKDLVRGEESGGFVLIEQDGASLTVGQPHGDEVTAPRLAVELVIGPGQVLELSGEDLSVTVEGLAPPPAAPPREAGEAGSALAAPAPIPGIRLDLVHSIVRVSAVGGLNLKANDTAVQAERLRGLVQAELEGGRLALDDQEGPVHLRGSNADVTLAQAIGDVEFALEGGNLSIAAGAGSCKGRSRSTLVRIEGWQGGVTLDGELNQVEVRESGAPEAQLSVSGERNDVLVEQFRGAVTAQVTGGSLRATDIGVRVRVEATEGAQVRVERVKEGAEVRSSERATLTVNDVGQRLWAVVRDGSLDAEGMAELELRADSAVVNVRSITGRARVQATDTQLGLDLSASRVHPDVKLGGSTQASIVMPAPCVVRVSEPEMAGQVTVSGCELSDGSNRPGTSPYGRRPGSRPDLLLIAHLDGSAELNVRATP